MSEHDENTTPEPADVVEPEQETLVYDENGEPEVVLVVESSGQTRMDFKGVDF